MTRPRRTQKRGCVARTHRLIHGTRSDRLMLLGSPPDMVHDAPSHGAHASVRCNLFHNVLLYTIPAQKTTSEHKKTRSKNASRRNRRMLFYRLFQHSLGSKLIGDEHIDVTAPQCPQNRFMLVGAAAEGNNPFVAAQIGNIDGYHLAADR